MLVVRDFGPEERILSMNEDVFGANMAFRLPVLKRFRFDPNLGPRSGSYIVGEETALIRELQANGHHGIWVPTAKVRHFTPRSRMTRRYVWKYFSGSTRTNLRMSGARPQGRLLFGAPRWLYLIWSRAMFTSLVQQVLMRRNWLDAFQRAAWAQGMIWEFRRQRRLADVDRLSD
jgi:hypothetical protein